MIWDPNGSSESCMGEQLLKEIRFRLKEASNTMLRVRERERAREQQEIEFVEG